VLNFFTLKHTKLHLMLVFSRAGWKIYSTFQAAKLTDSSGEDKGRDWEKGKGRS